MEGEVTNRDNDVVAIELPAPKGWKKRFTPKKGGTPKRNEIIFISPTGEEIKTKKQLDQYVKSHPEGPSASEFDWGTGDTPRRSARLSEKPKAEETPETEMPKKKQRRSSSSKKEAKGKKEEEEEEDVQATEETKETAAEETKETVAEETKETTEVATDGGEVVTKETPAEDEEDKAKEDAKQKAHEGGGVTEKVVDEKNIEKEENVATDAMEEDNTENKSVPTIVVEENNKEAEKESTEPEAPLTVTRKEEEVVKDVATPALEIGEEDQKKVPGENAEAVPPKPAGGGGEYQSGNYEPKTSQVSC